MDTARCIEAATRPDSKGNPERVELHRLCTRRSSEKVDYYECEASCGETNSLNDGYQELLSKYQS